jgi:CheY-like chemotaxis protein
MDDIEIERDLDLRIPLLALDVNRWQQVLINLTANAHQALAAADGSRKVIRFETRLKGDHVSIRVTDSGPGVPPDIRTRIFEPFFTTKQAGTGLGLGICYGIVSDHGGTIDLDPTVTEGACFRIALPLVREAAAPPDDEPAPEAARGRSRAGLGKRVLIVDDEEQVREVVGGALTNHHYVVDTAEDAFEALELLESVRYDAILTDVFMPGGLSGMDLHDRLIASRPELARRLIFLTGNILNDEVRARIVERDVPCLEKPFDIHVLSELVHEVAAGAVRSGALATEDGPTTTEAS